MKLGLLFLGFVLAGCSLLQPQAISTPSAQQVTSNGSVGVVVSNGTTTASYSAQLKQTDTVLSVLEQVSQQQGLNLEVKQYSFGTMVEVIDGLENSPRNYWTYMVDGFMGEVAADQKQLQPGQVVEWRYEAIK